MFLKPLLDGNFLNKRCPCFLKGVLSCTHPCYICRVSGWVCKANESLTYTVDAGKSQLKTWTITGTIIWGTKSSLYTDVFTPSVVDFTNNRPVPCCHINKG